LNTKTNNLPRVLLGDEAVSLGALDAGLTAAYGYPGTPSTEIMEYLIEASTLTHAGKSIPRAPENDQPYQPFIAQWGANEKTALEEALGTSFAGRRALVTMKHVGLNVAADPLMNGALCRLKGGLVIAVCDDPSMHSSQNEQDSRFFADFAKVPCLEPSDQQEAYDMTREAFRISERFHQPVILRLTTRLSHSRATVLPAERENQNPRSKALDRENWILVPARARVRWHEVLKIQPELEALSENSHWNSLDTAAASPTKKALLGVVCTGLGANYFRENLPELGAVPYLLIRQYPLPVQKIRQLAASVETLVVLEEGYPFTERLLRGLLPAQGPVIKGKLDGSVPLEGELTPEKVRFALGLKEIVGFDIKSLADTASLTLCQKTADGTLPVRPPQLCQGCPHGDSYLAIKEAIASFTDSVVTSDIGCYALGILPPYAVPETVVCMGASVSMAKGISEAGYKHTVAVIGDSTFFHSGLTPLVDAVSAGTSITVLVLDNSTTAMTGGQKTILPGERIAAIAKAIGVEPEHVRSFETLKKHHEQNVAILKEEIAYEGVSVVIALRECLETLRKAKKKPLVSKEGGAV